MKFILENYLVIILVGAFFIFALIGYLVELMRKDNKEEIDKDIPKDIKDMEISKIEKEEKIEKKDKADELLENYNIEKEENNIDIK